MIPQSYRASFAYLRYFSDQTSFDAGQNARALKFPLASLAHPVSPNDFPRANRFHSTVGVARKRMIFPEQHKFSIKL